jgi:hypothetical protein
VKLPKLVVGNIIIDAADEGHAVYRMNPWLYGVGSDAERCRVMDAIATFAAAIPYRALVLGVCREATTAQLHGIVAATTGARPSERWSRYVEDAAAMVDPTVWREWWVVVRLRKPRSTTGDAVDIFRKTLRSGKKRLEGENPQQVTLEEWQQDAAFFVNQLGDIGDRLEPATEAEIRWLYARSFRRGTSHEPTIEDVAEVRDLRGLMPKLMPGVDFSSKAKLDDGVYAHIAAVRFDDVPHKMRVPGPAQWIWELNRIDFNTDAVIWLERIPDAKAVKKSRRRRSNLRNQTDDGASLGGHQDDLDEMEAKMANSRMPAMNATYAVVVGADNEATLKERVARVQGLYPGGQFKVSAPGGSGVQDQMLVSTCPGMPWPLSVTSKNVTQYGLPDNVATSAMLCGVDLGDPQGIVLGTTMTGLREPVFVDPAWGMTRPEPTSGSIAVVGKTGSGKSITAKTLLRGSVAAGHQVVAFDRSVIRDTGRGEYEPFFEALDCSLQVITLHEDGMTMNPWLCLPPDVACQAAQDLTMILVRDPDPTGPGGVTINKACKYAEGQWRKGYIGGSGWDLMLHWLDWAATAEGESNSEARHIADVIRFCQDQPAARAIFGRGAPLRFDADATVIWAPNLRLPEPDDDEITLEQLIGRAVMGLVVLLGRNLFAANPGRFGALLVDEAWALLATKVGARWVTEFALEGRKKLLGVWVFTQAPEHIPNSVLKQMGYVGVTRVDPDQIPEALRLLGLPPDSDAAMTVAHEGSGVLTLRDPQGRVGAVHVLMPDDEELWAAMDTTPQLADA